MISLIIKRNANKVFFSFLLAFIFLTIVLFINKLNVNYQKYILKDYNVNIPFALIKSDNNKGFYYSGSTVFFYSDQKVTKVPDVIILPSRNKNNKNPLVSYHLWLLLKSQGIITNNNSKITLQLFDKNQPKISNINLKPFDKFLDGFKILLLPISINNCNSLHLNHCKIISEHQKNLPHNKLLIKRDFLLPNFLSPDFLKILFPPQLIFFLIVAVLIFIAINFWFLLGELVNNLMLFFKLNNFFGNRRNVIYFFLFIICGLGIVFSLSSITSNFLNDFIFNFFIRG